LFHTTQAAARHENSYLVNREKSEFIASNGDKRWLQGLDLAPKKLRDLNEMNKILAHRPWQLTANHIQRLTRGGQDNWSMSEVVHAIVILTHFHALSSFVWSSGITPDEQDENGSTSTPSSTAPQTQSNDSEASGVKNEEEQTDFSHSSSGDMTPTRKLSSGSCDEAVHPKGINIQASSGGAVTGPRTGQDSPPLDPHPGSPPNEASVEVSLPCHVSFSFLLNHV